MFPNATLWLDGNLMVGSLEPLRLEPATLAAQARRSRDGGGARRDRPAHVRGSAVWYTAGPDEMRRFVGPGPVLTDDQPLLEYHRSLPRGTSELDLSTLRGDVNQIID